MSELKCEVCGRGFGGHRALDTHRRKGHGLGGSFGSRRECSECGSEIWVLPSRLKRSQGHYCGPKCRAKGVGKEMAERYGAARRKVKCSSCGVEFETAPSKRTRFCSNRCRYAGHRVRKWPRRGSIERRCSWCGSDLMVERNIARKHTRSFCNNECRGRWVGQNVRGDQHPRWKGGVAKGNDGWPDGERRAWARAVKRKDGRQCQLCGRQYQSLWGGHSHHLLGRAFYPELRDVVGNGRTVCAYCGDGRGHRWLHSKAGEVLRLEWEREALAELGHLLVTEQPQAAG